MAAGARPIIGLAAILLLAGGIVMQFFIILSGINMSPLNKVYFLEASTAGITGYNEDYQDPARWTYLAICGVVDGLNGNCAPKTAALPFDPTGNFDTITGVPATFVSDNNYYFYMSRFAWVFYLIAVFFAVVAFFLSIFALFARLGAYLTGFTALIATFFQAIAAALMTAWVVKARDAWQSAGNDASIGQYAMGFTWGTFAAFLLASVAFCIGGSVGNNKSTQKSSYFGRKKSTRSRGSFVDSGSDRRVVKDEYE